MLIKIHSYSIGWDYLGSSSESGSICDSIGSWVVIILSTLIIIINGISNGNNLNGSENMEKNISESNSYETTIINSISTQKENKSDKTSLDEQKKINIDLKDLITPIKYPCLANLKGHKNIVWDVIELDDGNIASCSSDNSIIIWEKKSD